MASSSHTSDIDIASAPEPPTLALGAAVHPPFDNSKKSSDDQVPGNTDHELDWTNGRVGGWWTPVPQTYDPDTYDPDVKMPWTPEPEPYDPDAYAAWGRKHFGEDWYEQRKTMLQEQDLYYPDKTYRRRQKNLRILEHKIEGRPFEPEIGLYDKGWQRLWAQLSGEPSHVLSLSAEGQDPWGQLELKRERLCWSEEKYRNVKSILRLCLITSDLAGNKLEEQGHFERIFQEENRIDKARRQHEDEEGERWRATELEEMWKIQYDPGTLVPREEFNLRMRKFKFRSAGWTQDQIEAADRAASADWRWQMENPLPRGIYVDGIFQTDIDKQAAWLKRRDAAWVRIFGEVPPKSDNELQCSGLEALNTWRRNILDRISSRDKQESGVDAVPDASAPEEASRLPAPTPQATENTAQSRNVTNQDTRSRQIATTPAQSSVSDRQSNQTRASDVVDKPDESSAQVPRKRRNTPPKVDEKREKRASDAVEDIDDQGTQLKPHNKRQRKEYNLGRRSRRLAGHLPEYGMLPERGATPTNPPVEHTQGRIFQTLGAAHASPKRKPIAVKGAKHRAHTKRPICK